ncbi:tetratricopeptide repeat protein [Marinomonas posidonica]|uniref:tetratricopeptide repeat protein n=1 Tax=Marinomonas posidonica TaxID=936476 RepID=UPI003735CEE6
MKKSRYLVLLSLVFVLVGCAGKNVYQAGNASFDEASLEGKDANEALKLAHLLRDNGRLNAAYEVYATMDGKGQLEGPFLLEYASIAAYVIPGSDVIGLYQRAKEELGEKVTESQQQAICSGLGRAYLGTVQLTKATEQFNCALEANARSVPALNGLGVIASMNGNKDKARSLFQQALDIAPSNELVVNNLSLSWMASQEYQKAISLLKTKRNSENISTRLNLALAYVLYDREDMARELLVNSIARDKAEKILSRYVSARTRIQNGSPVAAEILSLTNTPLSLKDDV